MKEFKYIPKWFSDEDCTIDGHVVIIKPSVMQRFEYISACNFQVKEDGNVDLTIGKWEPILKALKLSVPHYKEIDIKKKDGSGSYRSFDELSECAGDADIEKLLFEIAGLMLSGFKPEKN